jgi:protein gp37
MSKTKIPWAEHVWNPIRGCSMAPGSEAGGCLHCYAARQSARNLPGLKSPTTGEPFAVMRQSGPRWTGVVELIPDALEIPLRRQIPTTFFVNSMSDLFHPALPYEHIDQIITTMVAAPQHRYLILTKRSAEMRQYFASGRHDHRAGPDRATYHLEQDIWLGVSAEDQPNADVRVADLVLTPASHRFVSYEPALARVDFGRWLRLIDVLIIGGESGPGARPDDLAWARQPIKQCRAAGVPVYMKQVGARPRYSILEGSAYIPLKMKDRKGGDPAEWPEDLHVRETPQYF